jgi:hypothetical protein
MKKNMGTLDRVLRFAIAGAIIALYFTHFISGTVAIVLLIVAAAFIITSFISFCPPYLPFGIRTRRSSLNEAEKV